MTKPLSLLDLAYIPAGSDSAATIRNAVEVAKQAEQLGYERVWYAEHHNSRGLASGTPEVMIAHVAAQTERIRVGSGGVMLPNQAPLKVAETFHLLEAMYPDRIDLGLGRAPGTDQKTALALRRNPDALAAEDYPQNVLELLAYHERSFPASHYFADIVATPADQNLPPVWLLGSSPFSGQLAAAIGLGFSFASHINKPLAVDVMKAYRAQFTPGVRYDAPHSILCVGMVIGETEEQAQDLALIYRVNMHRLLTGKTASSPSIEEARELAAQIPPQFQLQVDSMAANLFVGTPETVMPQAKQFAEECEADEVMITTQTADFASRSYAVEAVMAEWKKLG